MLQEEEADADNFWGNLLGQEEEEEEEEGLFKANAVKRRTPSATGGA